MSSRRWVFLSLATSILAACSETTPPLTQPSERSQATSLYGTAGRLVIDDAWARQLTAGRRMLATLEARRGKTGRADAERANEETIGKLQRALDIIAKDSAVSAPAFYARLSAERAGAPRALGWSQPQAGVFDDELSFTRFDITGSAPYVDVLGMLTIPAPYIESSTIGQYTRLGVTYNIRSHASNGDILLNNNTDLPPLPIFFGVTDQITLLADCSHYGMQGEATSQFHASWFIGTIGLVDRYLNKSGTDGGVCPRVPPVAHLQVSGDGGSVGDNGLLVVATPNGTAASISVSAIGTEHDAPITSYAWSFPGSSGAKSASGFDASFSTLTQAGVGLTVTDQLLFRSSAGASVVIQQYCDDPDATNHGQVGACQYPPPPICNDTEASNYGEPGDCKYLPPPPPPTPTCDDEAADNFGQPGECIYPPPPDVCTDWSASNEGGPLPCQYPPPPDPSTPPDDGSGSGGWDDPLDPCYYDWDPDWCGDGGEIYAMHARRPTHGFAAAKGSAYGKFYHVLLAEQWKDPSVLAIVARFRHKAGYVDAIYLPAKNASALGWVYAVRALAADRRTAADPSNLARVIRIKSDGTESFAHSGKPAAHSKASKPVDGKTMAKLDQDFRKSVLGPLQKAFTRKDRKAGSVQIIRINQ